MERFSEWADFFKAIADPTRLHILAILAHGPHCVCELVKVLGMAQPTVSHHLHRLREARLVQEERSGQWVFYRVAPTSVPFWDQLLATLPDVTSEVEDLARDQTLACHIGRPVRPESSIEAITTLRLR